VTAPRHPHSELPVLIAGAGIGGLSAALALARQGVRVRVLEAEPEFSESGAGIQIGPNGSRLLRSWGLGEPLHAHCGRPGAIRIHDGLSGAELASIPLGGDAESRYGAPYYVAERRVLHRLLLDAVHAEPQAEITPSFRLEQLQFAEAGIKVLSSGQGEATGRGLIGADGIHSCVRSLLVGDKAAFSGRNAWRATASGDAAVDAGQGDDIHLWMAPHAHLVHYRCGSGGPVNAVAVVSGEAASPGWGTAGAKQELMDHFDGWVEPARRMLGCFSNWVKWPLMTVPALATWSRGPVTLLGDAAHPIMPFLASGAVMAMEDAAVLEAEIERGGALGDIAAAFSRYENRRILRLARVQRASARTGEIYHMSGAMRLARNIALAALSGRRLLSRNDWLYGYRADADGRS
jgi:salicylate hydroxylase